MDRDKLSKKAYYSKNKQFAAWLPEKLQEWFIEYLEKHSYGANRSDKFRVFLYRIQELEQQGITLANPKAERQQTLGVDPTAAAYDICIRNLPREERRCELCRAGYNSMYRACQEIKTERLEDQRGKVER